MGGRCGILPSCRFRMMTNRTAPIISSSSKIGTAIAAVLALRCDGVEEEGAGTGVVPLGWAGVGVGPEVIPRACSSAPNVASNTARSFAAINVVVLLLLPTAAASAAAESSSLSCSNARVVCMMAVVLDAFELIDAFNAALASSWARLMRACNSNSSSVRFGGAAVETEAASVVSSRLAVVASAVGNAVGIGFRAAALVGAAATVAAVEAGVGGGVGPWHATPQPHPASTLVDPHVLSHHDGAGLPHPHAVATFVDPH